MGKPLPLRERLRGHGNLGRFGLHEGIGPRGQLQAAASAPLWGAVGAGRRRPLGTRPDPAWAPASGLSAPVAIAVVSWNTRDLLAECLRSMQPYADSGLVEVWVVDNASSDGSAELVAREFAWVDLIETGANLGFGPAVNLVAERTDSDWIAPSNADIQLFPGSLEALLAAADADPGAGIFAPRMVLLDDSTQASVHPFRTVRTIALLQSRLYRLRPSLGDELCLGGYWNPDRPRRVDWAAGAFLLIRRATWDAVGGFDEDQWMYAEDIDICWRAAEAGWATRYEPRAHVRHAHGAAAELAFGEAQRARQMEATNAWMARRMGIGAVWATSALDVAAELLRLAAFVPLAAAYPERFGRRRQAALNSLRLGRLGLRSRTSMAAHR